MYKLEDFFVRLAKQTEEDELISFLKLPEIDMSFVGPLSSRKVSIEDRVRSKFQCGFWLIVKRGARIVGCRGCAGITDQYIRIVDFSTTVVSSQFRGVGLGKELVRKSIEVAFTLYNPLLMRIDSWDSNKAMERIAQKEGFVKYRIFADPGKRPDGVLSVEYLLDCAKIRR